MHGVGIVGKAGQAYSGLAVVNLVKSRYVHYAGLR